MNDATYRSYGSFSTVDVQAALKPRDDDIGAPQQILEREKY